jgi:membrane protease YdiL (CAAX protease family)
MLKKTIHKSESECLPVPSSALAFAGFMASLLLMGGAAFFLLARQHIPWPFHGADTVYATYGRILVYLPFVGFSLLSVLWIKGCKRPVADYFKWNLFSFTFTIGFVLSAGYSIYLFLIHDFALKGLAFVPPAMLLGFLNAFSEELLFRLVCFQLVIPLTVSWQRANLVQAILYGFVHLVIGGPVFFFIAVGYGLLLGWVTRTNESLLPAIICHFIADIGAIGLPLLILT